MSSACVLVVDDEQPLRHLVRMYLEKERWRVVEAGTGPEALATFDREPVDLALIDVMLPELDGLEIVRRIRRISHIPIILLTARGEEASRVAGLEVGADDYVVKPFSMLELVARVRAQLRRVGEFSEEAQPEVETIGEVQLDRSARLCRVGDRLIGLTRREFDLLATMFDHAGHVLTRQQLLDAAWGTTFLSPKTVDVHIAALRKKLGDAVRITSLRGVGYRLEA
jgi:DNA-binding response OmpR family regulator